MALRRPGGALAAPQDAAAAPLPAAGAAVALFDVEAPPQPPLLAVEVSSEHMGADMKPGSPLTPAGEAWRDAGEALALATWAAATALDVALAVVLLTNGARRGNGWPQERRVPAQRGREQLAAGGAAADSPGCNAWLVGGWQPRGLGQVPLPARARASQANALPATGPSTHTQTPRCGSVYWCSWRCSRRCARPRLWCSRETTGLPLRCATCSVCCSAAAVRAYGCAASRPSGRCSVASRWLRLHCWRSSAASCPST
jgi:hypothetical protein